jgi:hypothetical protein
MLGHERCPANAAAQPDRNQDDVGIRKVIENLQGVRSDSRDEFWLIRRMHVARSVRGWIRRRALHPRSRADHLLTTLLRLVEIAPDLYQLGSEFAHRCSLVRVATDWNHDGAAHADPPACPRERLPVIARAHRDDAAGSFVVGQRMDEVDAATHFERADRQVILVLDPESAAQQSRQTRILIERRARQVPVDDWLRGHDVVVGDRSVHGRAYLRKL